MALITFAPAGQYGVNKDLSAHDMPQNAWTDALNIRFLDGYAHQFLGHGEVYQTPIVKPYHVAPVSVLGARYWLYASDKKIYIVTGNGGVTTHTNLTRQTSSVDVDYSANYNTWTSTVIGGIPVLNNGVDIPQRWSLDIAERFVALDAWDASWRCASLRTYKNFLVALNITKGSDIFPYMVKWSHPAAAGEVPVSWDETDATKDAGEIDLSDGYDTIVDGLQLRDSFMIYKQNSIWRMDYAGGAFIMSVAKVLGLSGAISKNCIVEIDGYHFVLTGADIIVHDGSQARSVLDKQARRAFFGEIDATHYANSFVFKNPFYNEAWVCYPTAGNQIPNKALVYNYVDNTVSFREMPSILHAACGAVETGIGAPWDSDSSSWDSDITLWDSSEFTPDIQRILAGTDDTKLFMLDSSTTFNGEIPDAYIERKGLSFGAPERRKLVSAIRPRILGTNGETVVIRVGAADAPYDTPTYGEPMKYTIGTDVWKNCTVDGRYIAIRFESDTAYQWRLDSFDVEVSVRGKW